MSNGQLALLLGKRGLAKACADSAAKAAIEKLVPLAQELAEKAGPSGITVSDLRIVGAQRNLLPNKGAGRSLSFLGKVLSAAGLQATTEYRRSVIPETHGNLNRVHVHRDFARVAA